MSTKALVATKIKDIIICSSVQYDGYPSNLGKELLENFNNKDRAKYVAGVGSIKSIEDGVIDTFDDDEEAFILDSIKELREIASKLFAAYYYYFNDDDEWIFAETDTYNSMIVKEDYEIKWLKLKEI